MSWKIKYYALLAFLVISILIGIKYLFSEVILLAFNEDDNQVSEENIRFLKKEILVIRSQEDTRLNLRDSHFEIENILSNGINDKGNIKLISFGGREVKEFQNIELEQYEFEISGSFNEVLNFCRELETYSGTSEPISVQIRKNPTKGSRKLIFSFTLNQIRYEN